MVKYEDIEDNLDTLLFAELKKRFHRIVMDVSLVYNKRSKLYKLEIKILDLVTLKSVANYTQVDYERNDVLDYLEKKYNLVNTKQISEGLVTNFVFTGLNNDRVIDLVTLCKLSQQ